MRFLHQHLILELKSYTSLDTHKMKQDEQNKIYMICDFQ